MPEDTRTVSLMPAVRTLEEIQESAVATGASDVHLEPWLHGGRVRLRVDGVLSFLRMLSDEVFRQVSSRVKLLSGMDIADKRMPQDGHYTFKCNERVLDARVSTMPTVAGEKVVIRVLDLRVEIPGLEDLGMDPALASRFRRVLHAPSGYVVVCGPTGSGKTTTLYSAIKERDNMQHQICSIEDPVEARICGVAQVQVNVRSGLTFSAALRSLLRQDPNVIMVGEMRDDETAKAAVSAALSGQLVLTTLHCAAPNASRGSLPKSSTASIRDRVAHHEKQARFGSGRIGRGGSESRGRSLE